MYYKVPVANGDLPSPPNQPGVSDMAIGVLVLDPVTGKPTSPGGGSGAGGATAANQETQIQHEMFIAERLADLLNMVSTAALQTALNAAINTMSAKIPPLALPAGADVSGTITGAAAKTLSPANPARRQLTGQNISQGDLWFNEMGGAAVIGGPGSYRVPPGASFAVSTNRAITVIGATIGQAWTATEF